MKEKAQINSTGYILKKERLASLASPIIYRELILEDLDPFPGFYDHYFVPANDNEIKPRSIFLVVKTLDICNEDKFIRMTMKIKQDRAVRFDAAMAIIHLFNNPTPCIRIFMDNYERLQELISHYKEAGMNFHPRRMIKPFQSLIEVRKYFTMEEIVEGIYKDLEQIDTYYLVMPEYVDWESFEQATMIIRNNMDHKLYDAAQAAVYVRHGLLDLVRIFDRKTNPETLTLLKQKYFSALNRH
jgi:hypothetical protein